jgi:hypothetical protein
MLLVGHYAAAHCDTLDGPVVKAARTALAKNDVTPALKWVQEKDEAEVKAAFADAVELRKLPQFQAVADRHFFDTLVRIHRVGEGESFNGLKPSGTPLPEAIAVADQALETGSPEKLIRKLSEKMATGITERYLRAVELRKHEDDSVSAGRESVRAYVEFVHHVEQLDEAAGRSNVGHGMHDH